MRQSAWLLYSIHLGSPLTVLVTAIHVAKWCSDSQAKSMSQAVAAAVRSGDRMRAERLLGEILKSKLPVDTMPFNSAPW